MAPTAPPPPLVHPYWRGAAIFAIVVGVAMLAVWVWLLASGDYPELQLQPLSGWVHMLTEIVTGVVLIVAGWALIAHKSWSRKLYLVAIGALLFAVINAVAFFGERDNIPLVIFFIVLAVVAVFFALRAEE